MIELFEETAELFRATHASFPHFFTGFFFVLGAFVGSFLNVCIFRIPAGESIVFPGSHCDCGKPIPFYLNVPIVSWLILRGRAACCGRKISLRHPCVELFTALVFAAVWQFLPAGAVAPAIAFCAFGIVLAFIDWDTMLLPDSVNALFVVAGLACGAAFPQALGAETFGEGIWRAAVGLGVGSLVVFWFRFFASVILRREAMGEGDVILLGGIGAFLGWRGAIFSFFFSAFVGLAAFGIVKIFSRERVAKSERAREASLLSCEGDEEGAELFASGAGTPFPLGPWLLISGAVYLFFQDEILALAEKFFRGEISLF